VEVRNSNARLEFATFTDEEWDTFVAAVKRGEFDRGRS
jgi:hypothetical protein